MTDNNITGVINVYKERGYTSHDVVNIVRKTLGKVKTGHTGTLDPDAEGVLPVCVGKATKLADYIGADVKEYKAELTLGIVTDTEDIWGQIKEKRNADVDTETVKRAILSFKGEYEQLPPMYSAIKIKGKKLYELAREGREVERKKRLINIYDIRDIKALDNNRYEFYVLCSKGTYIRSLCRDIGEKLGCGGCMSALTRTRSGNFKIEDSIKTEDIKKAVSENRTEDVIIPLHKILENYKMVHISVKAMKYAINGNKISLLYVNEKLCEGERVAVIDCNNRIIGIYDVKEDFIKPVTMLI